MQNENVENYVSVQPKSIAEKIIDKAKKHPVVSGIIAVGAVAAWKLSESPWRYRLMYKLLGKEDISRTKEIVVSPAASSLTVPGVDTTTHTAEFRYSTNGNEYVQNTDGTITFSGHVNGNEITAIISEPKDGPITVKIGDQITDFSKLPPDARFHEVTALPIDVRLRAHEFKQDLDFKIEHGAWPAHSASGSTGCLDSPHAGQWNGNYVDLNDGKGLAEAHMGLHLDDATLEKIANAAEHLLGPHSAIYHAVEHGLAGIPGFSDQVFAGVEGAADAVFAHSSISRGILTAVTIAPSLWMGKEELDKIEATYRTALHLNPSPEDIKRKMDQGIALFDRGAGIETQCHLEQSSDKAQKGTELPRRNILGLRSKPTTGLNL
ncbi:MAG: hypothetical protein PHW76_01710 [Alphaproteobacteria bacterium]|nr:hypothetical protein [Alphaproteobacteria bacterium]